MRCYKKPSLLIVAVLSIICACDKQNVSDGVDPRIARFIDFHIELKSEELEMFQEIKEKYYYQRFKSIDNNVYHPKDDLAFVGDSYYSSSEYFFWDNEIEINSIDDIKLAKCYSSYRGAYIVSFLYKGNGRAGAWWSTGAKAKFVESNYSFIFNFWGVNTLPEVFYEGQFYYIHEAWNMGIFNKSNPNILYNKIFKGEDSIVYIDGGLNGFDVEKDVQF